jgi:hypothetical protein
MLRYLSPSREWSEAPADLTAALKKLRTLPSHTLLVAGDGRVLGWAHAFGTPKKAPPLTVDAVTGAPTGRTGPILDERERELAALREPPHRPAPPGEDAPPLRELRQPRPEGSPARRAACFCLVDKL